VEVGVMPITFRLGTGVAIFGDSWYGYIIACRHNVFDQLSLVTRSLVSVWFAGLIKMCFMEKGVHALYGDSLNKWNIRQGL
jgi:hypothetical protein